MANTDPTEAGNLPPFGPPFPTLVTFNPQTPEIIPIESPNYPGPGVLAVIICEAIDLSVPHEYGEIFDQDRAATDSTTTLSNRQHLPYAILEFDRCQITLEAISGTREKPVWINGRDKRSTEKKFLVFRVAELMVHLYIKSPDTCAGTKDIFLGIATMKPSFESEMASQNIWIPIENGTGQIRVEIEYVNKKELEIKTEKWGHYVGGSRFGTIYPFMLWGTIFAHASFRIQQPDILPHSDIVRALLSPVNNSPFIAPLQLIARSNTNVCFFWQLMEGGHLFYHLQNARRFHPARAKLYAAEILLALDWLHELEPTYYGINPKGILLDSMGHAVLCDVGLLHLQGDQTRSQYHLGADDFDEDYVAPELLSSEISPRFAIASKWWTLGIFLYEMLTGLPPFYDEDKEQRRRNILSEPLKASEFLSESAQDLLTRLLVPKPEDRLGAKGTAEIKAHPFFDELDWNKVARRDYIPSFKPPRMALNFCCTGHTSVAKNLTGVTANMPITGRRQKVAKKATAESPDWVLVWQHEEKAFYFFNELTKARELVSEQSITPLKSETEPMQAGSVVSQSQIVDTNKQALPNETQKQTALDAVLKKTYMHLVPKLLKEYTINLNFRLSFFSATPLEYATELEDIKMVELFLANNADANFEVKDFLGGKPLLKAVQKGNQELVKMLVRVTDRVPCTRALGYAVSNKNISMVTILLASGVKCDFEDFDRPQSLRTIRLGRLLPVRAWPCVRRDYTEPAEYLPPLIRAVVLGDLELVQLLLSHGADVNIGYHDLKWRPLNKSRYLGQSYQMTCGRPIQLAMELEHRNVVQLLLDHGADINLEQPVWRHHCQMIPRSLYLQITARLRKAAESASAET